ncbi:helix-turn-helix domain-containing protein [Elusimicrobiota bacterium]
MVSRRSKGVKDKIGGFERYLYKTLRDDPQSRFDFLENLLDSPLSLQIRILRSFRGLTQVLLSKKTGLDQSVIARLEKVGANPRLSTLEKIDTVLNVQHVRAPVEVLAYWKTSLSLAVGDGYFSQIAGR